MASLDTAAVAALLREYGQRSALRGGNPYRAKAYLRAADSLGALTEPLGPIIAQGRLRDIPGVGDAIADIITKLYTHGAHPSLETMRKEIPAGVLEMLTVPGLRPDKVVKLYQELGFPALQKGGHDKKLVGYFQGDTGMINQLVHLWKFEDDADRRAHWNAVFANTDFVVGFAGKFRPLVMTQEVKLLNAAPWGPHP